MTEAREEVRNFVEGIHNLEYVSETTLTFRESNAQGEKQTILDELNDHNLYG